MYCSRCGIQYSDGKTHCVNCGGILGDIPPQPAGPEVSVKAEEAMESKTCGLAIAAFMMGMLSLTCVLWPLLVLPAIICGIVALSKIKGSKGQLKGAGYAVAGLVIPAVLTLLIPLFIAVLLPAIGKARNAAQGTVCATHMHSLSFAIIMLMEDCNDEYPVSEQWCDLLMEHGHFHPDEFRCPLDPEGTFSYAMNEAVYETDPKRIPAQMVVLFEAHLGRNGVGGQDDVVFRHSQRGKCGCNIMFGDGHIELVTKDRIPDLMWKVE